MWFFKWKWRIAEVLLVLSSLAGVSAGLWHIAENRPVAAPVQKVEEEPPVEEKPAPEDKPAVLPVPDDALIMALQDARRLPEFQAPFYRYVWEPEGTEDEVKEATVTLNVISRATIPQQPVVLYGGKLLRVDLRRYAPRSNDLVDWLKFWEDLRFDPTFSLLLTSDELKNIHFPVERVPKVKKKIIKKVTRQEHFKIKVKKQVKVGIGTPFLGSDGQYYQNQKIEEKEVEEDAVREVEDTVEETVEVPVTDTDVSTVRVQGGASDPLLMAELESILQTEAPIVHHRYFERRALTTIKDKGVFADVWGGRYYDFRGIKKAKDVKGKEKATDLDVFLELFGLGLVKANFTAEELFNNLRSDQRVAMFKSGVTGKPRTVEWLPSPTGRTTSGGGAITDDLKDQDVDINTHPIMNLLHFKAAAREAIFFGVNGMLVYALFDGDGNLLDEAAPDVVVDRTVPAPATARLQCCDSCQSCHDTKGDRGWNPVHNDVTPLLKHQLDVLFDISNLRTDQIDQFDRIAGLYMGNFDDKLRIAKDDYSLSLRRVAGPWKDALPDGTDTVKVGMGKLIDGERGYWYSQVTPAMALEELGLHVPKDDVLPTLNKLLPPDPLSRVGEVFPEDPRIGALLNGISIPRSDWSLVEGFAAERARRRLSELVAGMKP